MKKKKTAATVKMLNRTSRGKGGFTLVELSVVLALLAIITVMTVSFSALMSGFAVESEAEYEFIEDCHTLEQALEELMAENDLPEADFYVTSDGILTLSEKKVSLGSGTLSIGDENRKSGLDSIDKIIFSTNGSLIKCTLISGELEDSFVFSPRCGNITQEVNDGG